MDWTRDETIVACGLYFTLPFGQMHSRNPKIVEVAGLLGRTPAALAMKLTNLASLDPAHQARGVKGLRARSRLDEKVWAEFQHDWDSMALLGEEKLQALESPRVVAAEQQFPSGDRDTETEGTRKIRIAQSYFRRVVFGVYESRCCVTGNPVGELLVASHILPWSEFPKERLNPRNGICLAAHFDRAFDRGLISFDHDFRLILGRRLREYLPNPALDGEFAGREGDRLSFPKRFSPDPGFMAQHRHRFGFD